MDLTEQAKEYNKKYHRKRYRREKKAKENGFTLRELRQAEKEMHAIIWLANRQRMLDKINRFLVINSVDCPNYLV